jgi:hypothetical protein
MGIIHIKGIWGGIITKEDLALVHRQLQVRHRDECAVGRREDLAQAWEKQVLSARGFKRVGRCSEYAI